MKANRSRSRKTVAGGKCWSDMAVLRLEMTCQNEREMHAKYLPLYAAEFQSQNNNRMNPNIFGAAISGC